MLKSPVACVVLTMALAVAACGGSTPLADTETQAPDTDESENNSSSTSAEAVHTPAVTEEDVDDLLAPDGEWTRSEVSFESYQTGPESIIPEVRKIVRIGETYWAYGSDENGAGAIWKSDNLEHFDKALTTQELQCCRLTRFHAIVEFKNAIVAGGTVRRPGPEPGEDIEHSMLVFSQDDGASWRELDDPAFSTPFHRLDDLHVAGGTLIADIYEDECCATGPIPKRVFTTDLSNWEPVIIDSASGSTGIVSNGRTFWAISYPQFGTGEGQFWQSTDAITWQELDRPEDNSSRFVPVGSTIMQVPQQSRDSSVNEFDPRVLSVLVDGIWVEAPQDLGQFGDGEPSFRSRTTDHAAGTTYAVLMRQRRANPHYCFEDQATCAQYQVTLATTNDSGLTWGDLPGVIHDEWGRGSLFIDANGNPVYWTQESGSEIDNVTITQWTGADHPRQVDPPGYLPPDMSLPLVSRQGPLDVGDHARFIWAFGSCTRDDSIYVGEREWESIETIDPNTWPYREIDVSDGPNRLAYWVLHRVSENEMEFLLPDIGLFVQLQPAPPPDPDQPSCG